MIEILIIGGSSVVAGYAIGSVLAKSDKDSYQTMLPAYPLIILYEFFKELYKILKERKKG